MTPGDKGANNRGVGVVIPLYNRAGIVPRTLQSVLEQKFLPARLVIVDDGSTDGTAERLRAAFPHVRVIVNERRGVSSARNRGIAAVNGHRVPVIGRVSMDLITLDVTGVPDECVQPGCRVDLIGPDISLEEVARRAGTINYEILTRLGQRAQRRFLGGPERDAKSRSG